MAGQEYFNHKQIIAINLQVGIIVNAAYGIITAMAVYSFMYYPKSVSLWGSLPVKREAVFASGWLSGIVMMIGTGLVTFLISLIYQLCSGSADVTKLLIWWQITQCSSVLYGRASLCAVLTAALCTPVVNVIFNFVFQCFTSLSELGVFRVYGFSHMTVISTALFPIVRGLHGS
jgi:ABC-type transport system involved in multi-copper enzyme maturation permease subunit